MGFLFHKALALAGYRDNPQERRKLFEHFGGGEDLRRLCAKIDAAVESPPLEAVDPFDTSFPDPNLIAGFFDEPSAQSSCQRRYEDACQQSETLLSEAAATAQILRLFQEDVTSAPKSCRQRAYQAGEPSKSFRSFSPPRRKVTALTSLFRSADRSGSKRGIEDSDDELSRFKAPPIAEKAPKKPFSKKSSSRFHGEREKRPERGFAERTEEISEKKRGIFLPFVCASIAAALLFHFYPILHSNPPRRTPSFPTVGVEQSVADPVLEPADTTPVCPASEAIDDFEEAPLYEKIATPPERKIEPFGEFPAAGAPFAWQDLSLLSDHEKAAMTGVRPVCRPLRRGAKTHVVTVIPEDE